MPLDLDDDLMIFEFAENKAGRSWAVCNRDDSQPLVALTRTVLKDGNILEGQDSEDLPAFRRRIDPDQEVSIGFMKAGKLHYDGIYHRVDCPDYKGRFKHDRESEIVQRIDY